MKRLIEIVLLLSLCPSGLAIAQNQCSDCKCTEYPVPSSCKKCCGVITGKVTSATASNVRVMSVKGSEDLRITELTRIEGTVHEGDTVTVQYNLETKIAGLIKVLETHGRA